MPLFRRSDPGLRPLITYIVARSQGRDITLNRTKLVKLLYLIDIERVRSRREPLTGLDWVFFHYGPYAFELAEVLDEMDGRELIARSWYDSVLYETADGAPAGEDWPPATKLMIDRVVDQFGPLELRELLDYVYFETGPMLNATRGQPLDLSRARSDVVTRRPPLTAPAAPEDIEDRLARWRAETARRLPRVTLDPPGSFIDEPQEDAISAVHGRLSVPDDISL